jgi:hypothetical protein
VKELQPGQLIQLLSCGEYAEQIRRIGKNQEKKNRSKVRREAFIVAAHVGRGDFIDAFHKSFNGILLSVGNRFQIPGEHERKNNQNGHNNPHHNDTV